MRQDGRYRCAWCGHRGSRIWEQVARLLTWIPAGGTLADAIRYACWVCGQEIRPG